MAVRNLTHGQLVIKDGGGSSVKSLTIPIEVGNLKWSEPSEAHPIHDRKTLVAFAEGRDQPMEVSFTIAYEAYTGDTAETTPVDALTKTGVVGSTWVSTESSGPYAVDLEFTLSSPDTSKTEVIILPNFHKENLEISEDEDFTKIAVTGKCRASRPTVTRV